MITSTQTPVRLVKGNVYSLEGNTIDEHPTLRYIGDVQAGEGTSFARDRAVFVSTADPDLYLFINPSSFVEVNGANIKTHGLIYTAERKCVLSCTSKLIKMLEALGEKL